MTNFQIKILIYFHISAQNIDCGYSLEPPHRGGSNEYPQSMFLSGNNKNKVYPCKPQFFYIKVGYKGTKLYRRDGIKQCLFLRSVEPVMNIIIKNAKATGQFGRSIQPAEKSNLVLHMKCRIRLLLCLQWVYPYKHILYF